MNVEDNSGELEEFAAYYRLAEKLISAASKEQVPGGHRQTKGAETDRPDLRTRDACPLLYPFLARPRSSSDDAEAPLLLEALEDHRPLVRNASRIAVQVV